MSASEIANHYKPGIHTTGQGYRIPCPSAEHRGDGDGLNLDIRDGDRGGLLVKCWSSDCSFQSIFDAFRADGLTIERTWTYSSGIAKRVDAPGQDKDFDGSHGSGKGAKLQIRNGPPDALVVIVEGESDADAVESANLDDVVAACYKGGSGMAPHADYGATKGRRVAIWPDNDAKGATCQWRRHVGPLGCRSSGEMSG